MAVMDYSVALDKMRERLEAGMPLHEIDRLWLLEVTGVDATEKWREEGRREILREIAKAFEFVPDALYDDGGDCLLCGQSVHHPSCLWLRAQAVKD